MLTQFLVERERATRFWQYHWLVKDRTSERNNCLGYEDDSADMEQFQPLQQPYLDDCIQAY